MKRILLIVIAALAISVVNASAQARPTDRFAWDTQDTITAASSYGWDLELDGVVLTTRLSVTCVAGTPVSCSAPIPAVTPSQHTVRIRAVDVSVPSAVIEGPFSLPFTFTMRVVPFAPTAVRVIPG